MMFATKEKSGKFDWVLIALYFALVIVGWLNIFSAVYSDECNSIFDFSQKYGMQFIWIISASVLAFMILFIIPQKLYFVIPPLLYVVSLALLLIVVFVGKEVNGSKSWFVLGPISFQPAEISKISTSLFLAYIMGKYGFRFSKTKDLLSVLLTLLIPMLLILMEKETGSALVYLGFMFVLYREGLNGWVLILGIISIVVFVVTLKFSPTLSLSILLLFLAITKNMFFKRENRSVIPIVITAIVILFIPLIQSLKFMEWSRSIKSEYIGLVLIVPIIIAQIKQIIRKRNPKFNTILTVFVISILLIFSVNFIFDNILKPHQRARIENLLGIEEDLKGVGYNVHQSKIAIGSGGFWGKGYLQGTQTKFNFVPEQSTDFIFCTIGEEWGFFGSSIIVILYILLICRIIIDSENQQDSFTRIYGYCVASCFFMHVFINIGMTIGLVPVIGIPLPFLSYGGSSLWSFTILLFIFVKLQQQRG